MSLELLQIVWFLLFFVLVAGYAILDGFDLGAGVLSLFTRDDGERRVIVNAVAPVWDGNEVWLLTGGGALFAAFPPVYATVFSGFYLALMLVLLGLILRAVSMEFRGKVDDPGWRRLWDVAFGVGSLLPALLFGVAVGNLLRGLPLATVTDAVGTRVEFAGSFFGLLNPFSLLVGLAGLAMMVTQGALWLGLKADGPLRERATRWTGVAWLAWVVCGTLAAVVAFFDTPALLPTAAGRPLFWVFLVLMLAALAVVPAWRRARPGLAFLASSTAVAAQVGVGAATIFPNLVPSRTDAALSLTLANASSTRGTLSTMLVIALIGVPIVLVYTAVIYRAFRGKVVLDEHSY
jgi:cytochrome d ubiquinol oxidase subunit II